MGPEGLYPPGEVCVDCVLLCSVVGLGADEMVLLEVQLVETVEGVAGVCL